MSEQGNYSVLILTKNEEANLPYALESTIGRAAETFVLDSGSTDRTRDIAESMGAKFVHQPWLGFARQKNWGIDNLPFKTPWVFILDADEVITPELARELAEISNKNTCEEDGFYVNRFFVFLGKRINHCGYYPSWNLRFFRKGKARYEEREVHEHMVVNGKIGYLHGEMKHNDRRGMEHYIAKHNQYSTLEAREMLRVKYGASSTADLHASFFGGPIERRRWLKEKIWPRLPAKWLMRFLFMYIYRLGIMDGAVGFHFCFFLAAYEHQISLKRVEMERTMVVPALKPQRAPALTTPAMPAIAGGSLAAA